MFRSLLLTGVLGLAVATAHAREAVPVMNFEDIPVSLSTSKKLSAEQVHQAILTAGTALAWQMVEKGPGTVQAIYRKGRGSRHVVFVMITYDAEKYSASYAWSLNMKYEEVASPSFDPKVRDGKVPDPDRESAVRQQLEAFAGQPETAYAKPAPGGVIHPYYERWLRELLTTVRVQLSLADAAVRASAPQ